MLCFVTFLNLAAIRAAVLSILVGRGHNGKGALCRLRTGRWGRSVDVVGMAWVTALEE